MNDDNRDNAIDLSQLQNAPVAPKRLEHETVEHLRRRGVIAEEGSMSRATGRRVRNAWVIAASVLLLATGVAIGRAVPFADPAAPTGDYILLLRESTIRESDSATSGGDAMYEEYARWSRQGRHAGAVVAGERLRTQTYRIGDSVEPDHEVVSGYFVIQADSLAAALEVAQDCPHLRHGGAVEVRQFDRP